MRGRGYSTLVFRSSEGDEWRKDVTVVREAIFDKLCKCLCVI